MLDDYKRDLTGFLLTTEIHHYLEADRLPSPTGSEVDNLPSAEPNYEVYSQLKVKIKANITDRTMKYVQDVWNSLASHLSIPLPALLLHRVAAGCISITWLVPANRAIHIVKSMQESQTYFAKHDFLRVTLDDDCYYSTEEEVSSEHRRRRKKKVSKL